MSASKIKDGNEKKMKQNKKKNPSDMHIINK